MTAFWRGALRPRRRAGRRADDVAYAIIDWHSPRLFAMALAILGLCVLDGVLTIMLMNHGAIEINPLLALLLPDKLGWFATLKLLLTSLGLCVLVACARMRLFRRIPGVAFVYAVLALYICLITYELQLLRLALFSAS